MSAARVTIGLTMRSGARSLTLVAACVAFASLAACGRARPVGDPAANASLRYPRDAARFIAEPVSDSTYSFAADDSPWVSPGMLGIAVDPTRGDALVARLLITNVTNGRVEALVTGQTTRVASGHVVLLVKPQTPWWRHRLFWLGSVNGALFVGTLALLL